MSATWEFVEFDKAFYTYLKESKATGYLSSSTFRGKVDGDYKMYCRADAAWELPDGRKIEEVVL